MSIFAFEEEQALGEVIRIETARVWVRVTSPERVRLARVGRLVAIKCGDINEWVVGMVERIWRSPLEAEEVVLESVEEDIEEALPLEDNGLRVVLVGTYRAVEGERRDVFTRAVLVLPSIDEKVFPVEEKALEDFMGTISHTAEEGAVAPLAVGRFTLDEKATAFLDGNKLFQRHAVLVGSTGVGAALLEQAAKLPNANVVLFDLHGEYKSLDYAHQLKVAGPGDMGPADEGILFLPYWLLNYEEMQDMFIVHSEHEAHNQAMVFRDAVGSAKRSKLEDLGKDEILSSFTIDSPVPFELDKVIETIKQKNEEMVPGARNGTTKKGDFHGQFARFLIRLESKRSDRRYVFMYQAPDNWMEYEALHRLACLLLGRGTESDMGGQTNAGVKVVDFSEVPSDVLPVIVSLVARLVFQLQFWMHEGDTGERRHPVLLVCDEAHLYLPSLRSQANPLERRALENFERIAKEGRKYGVGLLVVSQRPADVSTTQRY